MESKIKHLEIIQNNITRMNQCSFQIKTWSLTIVTALLTFYATTASEGHSGNVLFIIIAIVPTAVFWFLDSYYLQQERKFRGIYNDVANLTEDAARVHVKEYEMPLNKYFGGKYSYVNALFSQTEWPLYLIMIIGLSIAAILL